MKIAIPAQEDNLDSLIHPKFARADYIIVVDVETLIFESINNSKNKERSINAGRLVASILKDKKVEALVTGSCGSSAFEILKKEGIKVAIGVNGRVIDVVNNFKNGQLVFAEHANVNGSCEQIS